MVPEAFPVTAFFGNVVLDLREAVLQSPRITIYATAVAGQIRLIVPAGVAVEMVGRSFLGTRSVRGSSGREAAASHEPVPARHRSPSRRQSAASVQGADRAPAALAVGLPPGASVPRRPRSVGHHRVAGDLPERVLAVDVADRARPRPHDERVRGRAA